MSAFMIRRQKAAWHRRSPRAAAVHSADALELREPGHTLVIDPQTSSQCSAYTNGLSFLIPIG